MFSISRDLKTFLLASSVISLLASLGCAKPPLQEIADAEAALEKARGVEAQVYAPETFASAEEMLTQAKEEMDLKKYKPSRESALKSQDLSNRAIEEAVRKKAAEDESAREHGLTEAEKAAGPTMETEAITVAELEEEKTGTGALEEGVTITSLKTVYFAFDDFSLSEASRETVAENSEWLKKYINVKIQIEGHCDERGSNEYNLALGERRAKTTRDYLVYLGVDPGRLSVITYGEEVPVDPGHDETAWAKNRRAEFVVQTD